MMHKYASKLHGFPFTLRTITRSTIVWSQNFNSTKKRAVLVYDVKGEPRNVEAYLCGFCNVHLFNHNALYNKQLQTISIDQIARSKATRSFKYNA